MSLNLQVLKVEEEALILSKRKVDAEKSWDQLAVKFENSEIFEAEIKDVVKGGLSGGFRCSRISFLLL